MHEIVLSGIINRLHLSIFVPEQEKKTHMIRLANVLDVCSFILFYAHTYLSEINRDRTHITNLWLQKALYYVYGEFYGLHRRELFLGNFEAWQYGPVSPEAYIQYRNPSYHTGRTMLQKPVSPPSILDDSAEEATVIDIVKKYAPQTAAELVTSTHNEQPWLEATDNGKNAGVGVKMDAKTIQRWFVLRC